MTKREICERLLAIWEMEPYKNTAEAIKHLLLDLAAPETEEKPVQEPKSKFPTGNQLHMSAEEMKDADTALFTQTGGRMGKDWRNAEERKEPPVLIYEENGEKVPCPVCGAPAAPTKNKPSVFLCKRCGGLVCAEEGE